MHRRSARSCLANGGRSLLCRRQLAERRILWSARHNPIHSALRAPPVESPVASARFLGQQKASAAARSFCGLNDASVALPAAQSLLAFVPEPGARYAAVLA